MAKPAQVTATDRFSVWRSRFNSLLSIAAEVVEDTVDPTADADSTFYENGTLWINTSTDTGFILVDNTDTAAVWVQLGATPGALINDGSVPLTTDWDAGSHQIRAETFQSDVATGTAPFTVASTTVVANLNADTVDGVEAVDLNRRVEMASSPGVSDDSYPVGTLWVNTTTDAAYVCVDNAGGAAVWTELGAVIGGLLANGSVALTADWDAGSFQIRAETFQSDVTGSTPPFTVASSAKVANLNADLLDGYDSTAFVLADGTVPLTDDWNASTDHQIQAKNILKYDVNVRTSSFTAVEGWLYSIETDTTNTYGHGASATNVSVTLPASPAVGDQVGFMHVGDGDVETPAANENLTILRNGRNIMGIADDLNVDANNANFRMVYVSSGWGWQVSIL